MATETLSLYERAGGEPFFEALVARFYAGVADDPLLRPIYPEADLAPATHRLTRGRARITARCSSGERWSTDLRHPFAC